MCCLLKLTPQRSGQERVPQAGIGTLACLQVYPVPASANNAAHIRARDTAIEWGGNGGERRTRRQVRPSCRAQVFRFVRIAIRATLSTSSYSIYMESCSSGEKG